MLPNEVFALECIARYAKEGLDVKKGGVHDGYPDEFAHCPYPRPKGQNNRLSGDLGYWLTFYDHQRHGLLQSVDVGSKCYWTPKVKLYLDTWPPGCFELWDIYDRFNKLTEETKERMSVAKSGRTFTAEWKQAQSERMTGRTGALSPISKAIIVIKPDGTELYFGGVNEAARELGIPQGSLSRSLKEGHVITRGKAKGYQSFYEVKE